jgi:hypothetical protein
MNIPTDDIFKKLAVGLANYEMDEPHVESPDCTASDCYGTITYEQLIEGSETEHHGDCVSLPCSCFRCYADHILHKANWLYGKMNEI